LKKNRTALWIGLVVILAVALYLLRGRIHFDWHTFLTQLERADWKLFGLGVLLIYLAYFVRAMRWALFLKPTKQVSPVTLLGTQVIGFTAVALFGRLADLVRPYLVSRRTGIPLTSQIAVWALERIFDLGSNGIIFAAVLLLAPDRKTIPHHELANRVALLALAGVVFFILFAIFTRIAGQKVAHLVGKIFGTLSPKLGENVREKILVFRDGLNAITSFGDFVKATLLSLVMWMMVVYAYLETVRAFSAEPVLHSMTLSRCLILMVASQAASIVQLPVIGWFTQIGLVAKAIQSFFGASPESSLGAATMLLVVTFLSVIPTGVIWARFGKISLKKLTEESETAGEAAEHTHAGEAQADA
jgi:uncharacterized protein (TIRG00374 family)